MATWEIEIRPVAHEPDAGALRLIEELRDMGLSDLPQVVAAKGYILQGPIDAAQAQTAVQELLADPIVEHVLLRRLDGESSMATLTIADPPGSRVNVLLKPGVTDPVAESTLHALREMSIPVLHVATFRRFWFSGLGTEQLRMIAQRILANDSIERILWGPITPDALQLGASYELQLQYVRLLELDDRALERLSQEGQLYLSLSEMRAIQSFFRELGREPTDIELETIAQTWSEHCSHKTLTGPVEYRDELGTRRFENLLGETIFAATHEIRQRLGPNDWCVSVFRDNAGVIRFDDDFHVTFKVETHNHPSALEPYGGANTGLGGVIRDTLGTGLGADPIANTDVFCFAPPDTPLQGLPAGVLHPRQVLRGVVAGVRDYGNRMGIPTVNGAICFDPRYLANPLVFCGSVGRLPRHCVHKEPHVGDWIVTLGGRTGRDGIHGATFSSAELTSQSEQTSGGAVQIGNAIHEKMLMDVLLQARDQGLFHAVTDCGAGGFSSAVGEMAAELGAEVWLERAPLKYEGLSYTEIWISEAQERMVLAIPPANWETFQQLAKAEGVEATCLGRFTGSGELVLKYADTEVGRLPMKFLHRGRPKVPRVAVYQPHSPPLMHRSESNTNLDCSQLLLEVLNQWNVASKAWVIRQYDHEVQGTSVIKPLVGVSNDGPGDAAVIRPRLDSQRGIAIACGINPNYGDYDTYRMAASAIDEAIRNCVAVGADPNRIALLDNFCWGNTDRPDVLGSLVRAALGCHDLALAFRTPFISGKDSLKNEFTYQGASGVTQTLSIPPTLLISALGQVPDVDRCVTMDLKSPGNAIYLVGVTKPELGGSQVSRIRPEWCASPCPSVDPDLAPRLFAATHAAIQRGYVRACHDLSDGGLAVAVAEMAFAGGWGAEIELSTLCLPDDLTEISDLERLFSESNTRFLCEVPNEREMEFRQVMAAVPHARLGTVAAHDRLIIRPGPSTRMAIIDIPLAALKAAWLQPLNWESLL